MSLQNVTQSRTAGGEVNHFGQNGANLDDQKKDSVHGHSEGGDGKGGEKKKGLGVYVWGAGENITRIEWA